MARKKKKRREFSTVFAFMSDPPPDEVGENEDNAPRLRGETSLWDIRPDPGQPRNLLPISLDEQFKTNQLSPQETIKAWQALGSSSFENLRKLADSIAQHGLINPITVRPAPSESEVKYLIVTGERRWWSHVLLASEDRHINRGNSSRNADQIKINLTPEGTSIRAHQLIENLIREDLNAVEKAKGMWALRLELSGVPADSDLNYSSPPPQNLVPWTEVEKALDISSRYRSYITSALQLTEEAQRLVQEHDLSESLIRPIVQKLSKEPGLQMKALEQLLAWQQSEEAPRSLTRAVKQLVDELLHPPAPVMTRHASVATTEEVPAASSQSEHSASPALRETPRAYNSEDTKAPWAGKEVSEPFNGAATAARDGHEPQDLTSPTREDTNTYEEGREDLTVATGSQAEPEEETLVRERSVTPSSSEPMAGPLSEPDPPEPDSDEISHEINLTASSLLKQLEKLDRDRVTPESWLVLIELRDQINALAN